MHETALGQAEPSLLHAEGCHLNNAKPQARTIPEISEDFLLFHLVRTRRCKLAIDRCMLARAPKYGAIGSWAIRLLQRHKVGGIVQQLRTGSSVWCNVFDSI